jgi:hypothetical protein
MGDTVTAEQILEAPKEADVHSDDSTYPGPRQICSDCAGQGTYVLLVCSSANCSCDSTTCPTASREPKCSDTNYDPFENRTCTKESPGCDCTPEEELPGVEDITKILECDECGESLNRNRKCQGVSTSLTL